MEQDYYMETPNTDPPETPPVSSETAEPQKRKMDPQLAILAMQAIICALVLLACVVIKLFFGGFFVEMRDWYNQNVNVDTDISQVLDGSSSPSGNGGPLEAEDTAVSADLKGGFTLPMTGAVSSRFGYRADPFTGETAFHHGLDLAAEAGTPVKASVAGRVRLAAENNSDYGNYIILEHGGFETLYGHCSRLLVQEGQMVKAGETIALCGSTGRSTGPHLHFEIRIDGHRIDPEPFLKLP